MTRDAGDLLSIGELSRASGLSVSSLRFYDREKVLEPAAVDAWTGYRRYAPEQVDEARLLAGMRRVQMPVAEMTSALEALRAGDGAEVTDLLHGHLQRLELGVVQARREIGRLVTALTSGDGAPRPAASLTAAALRQLLAAVRHAVSADPVFPALQGVLVETGEGVLTLVATDRYRMVVARHDLPPCPGAAGDGPADEDAPGADGGPVVGASRTAAAVLPVAEVDRLVDLLEAWPSEEVRVSVTDDALRLDGAGTTARLRAWPPTDFPDYRRVLEAGTADQPVTEAQLRTALDAEDPLTWLGEVQVDREFLWQAVDAVPGGQVLLPAEGVIAPLLVRSPDATVLALVMPVAPEAS